MAVRIRFIKPYGINEGQGAGPHYEEGKEYDFKGYVEEGYARAYIERGAAVEVKEEPKPVIKPVEARPVLKLAEKPADAAGVAATAPATLSGK